MKWLHIFKSEPDEQTKTLMECLSQGGEATEFGLYEEGADYGKLIDLIFEHKKVMTWW
jgi:hypothetical protein